MLERLDRLIFEIRGQKVMLNADLAAVYGVETRVLKQAVRRNREKFPSDFVIQLTREETREIQRLRSRAVILKRGQHIKHLPYAFTEHGAIMAAMVLNSPPFVVILSLSKLAEAVRRTAANLCRSRPRAASQAMRKQQLYARGPTANY